jgi:hypothetical protein
VNCLERESPRARSIFVRLSTDEGRRGFGQSSFMGFPIGLLVAGGQSRLLK